MKDLTIEQMIEINPFLKSFILKTKIENLKENEWASFWVSIKEGLSKNIGDSCDFPELDNYKYFDKFHYFLKSISPNLK